MNIRWSCEHLIFIIPVPGKMFLTFKQDPGYWCYGLAWIPIQMLTHVEFGTVGLLLISWGDAWIIISQCFVCFMSLIIRFMGPMCGPSGANRTQVGPMLAPWTLLSGVSVWIWNHISCYRSSHCKSWSSYLYIGNSYTGKRASLYWNKLLGIM